MQNLLIRIPDYMSVGVCMAHLYSIVANSTFMSAVLSKLMKSDLEA